MRILEAALAVLRDADRPLTTREVAERVLARDLIATTGKTPDASISAALYVAVRRNRAPGLECLSEPGKGRAKRGSVRWRYRRP